MNENNDTYTYNTFNPDYGDEKNINVDNKIYPEIKCKQYNNNLVLILVLLLFAVVFGSIAFGIIYSMINSGELAKDYTILIGLIPFYIFPIIGIVFFTRMIVYAVLVNTCGREITGMIYDFKPDNLFINNKRALVALIKIPTPEGDRTIRYRLFKTEQPCNINTEVDLIVYKDIYKIKKIRGI